MSGENVVGGPADEISVREFANKVAEMTKSVISRDWLGAVRSGGTVLRVAADLLGLGNVFGAGAADAEAEEAWLCEAAADCEECRKALEGPQPIGDEADPKKIDPATILLIIDLVVKLIEAIRKRRNPNP